MRNVDRNVSRTLSRDAGRHRRKPKKQEDGEMSTRSKDVPFELERADLLLRERGEASEENVFERGANRSVREMDSDPCVATHPFLPLCV